MRLRVAVFVAVVMLAGCCLGAPAAGYAADTIAARSAEGNIAANHMGYGAQMDYASALSIHDANESDDISAVSSSKTDRAHASEIALQAGNLSAQTESSLPRVYDSRSIGVITPVRNQGTFGTCWAFATIASLEASLLLHGQVGADQASNMNGESAASNHNAGEAEGPGDANNTEGTDSAIEAFDLSERHLAYFAYHPAFDPLGYTDEDLSQPTSSEYLTDMEEDGRYLTAGGNFTLAAFALASWRGAADETAAPYGDLATAYERYLSYKGYLSYVEQVGEENASWAATDPYTFDDFLADTDLEASSGMSADSWHLTGFRRISLLDTADVKRAVMEYGAAAYLMYYDDQYMNWDKSAYYCYNYNSTNHGVTIVGWDDDYSCENFATDYSWADELGITVSKDQTRASTHNGAWLCKNSWGADWGDGGYFWVSYDDASMSGRYANAFVFEAESADDYDNIYQHDGSNSETGNYVKSGGSIASMFTAKGNEGGAETLNAVSFALDDVNVDYSVQVYLNVREEANPESGSPALSQPVTGKTSYAGYYTLPLSTPIPLEEGCRYSVVITLSHASGSQVRYSVDASSTPYKWVRFTSVVHPYESFERDSGDANAKWDDLADWTSKDTGDQAISAARVKAFTRNVGADELTALSFDDAVATLASGNATGTGTSADEDEGAYTFTYTGNEVRPAVRVLFGGKELTEGVDFSLTYKNNVGPGRAKAIVSALGVYAGRDKVLTYTIEQPEQPTQFDEPEQPTQFDELDKSDQPKRLEQVITASNKTKTYGAVPFALGAKTSGDGKLTYASNNKKVASVSKSGKVTVRSAGTAKIKIRAVATTRYEAASKTIVVKVRKAKQPLTVKANGLTLRPGKAAKSSKAFAVSKAQGKVTFKKLSGDKRIAVAKNGKVTTATTLSCGTYKLKVKATAKGNTNYKSGSKTIKLIVKVSA